MSARPLFRYCLPAFILGVGLVIGSLLSISKRVAEFSAAVDRRLAESSEMGPAPNIGRGTPPSREDDVISAMMGAAAEKDPLLRAYRLREFIYGLESRQLAAVFERALHVENRELRGKLLVPLLTRWAEIDSAAANAAVQPYRDRMRAVWRTDWRSVEASVNDAWAKALPEAALAEAVAAPNAWWAFDAARSSIEALGGGDPAKMLQELSKLPPGKLRDNLSGDPLRLMAERDFAAAEAQLELVSDPRERARLQADILSKLADRDPKVAIDRLIELTPNLGRGQLGYELVTKVLGSAGKKNASDALAAVERLPEDMRNQAQAAVLVGWSSEHSFEALEWAVANGVTVSETNAVEYLEGINDGVGGNSLISSAFDSDREKTLAWLRAQPPSAERDSLLMSGIWRGTPEQRLAIYSELGPDARKKAVWMILNGNGGLGMAEAEDWVNNLPGGPERIAGVLSLASREALANPDRIESIPEAWPAGPERDAAIRGIVQAVSQNDRTKAIELARGIGNPDLRANTMVNIASSWLYENEAAARAWLATTSDLSGEDKRVMLRLFEGR